MNASHTSGTSRASHAFHVESHDSLEAVREVWAGLARDSRAPLFHHPPYLDAYAAAPLHHIARTSYLLARDRDGAARAALPLFHQPEMDPLGVLRHQLPARPGTGAEGGAGAGSGLLSHVWHCYDTRILARGPLTAPLLDALLDAAHRIARDGGAQWYGLVNVEAPGALATALDRAAPDRGMCRVRVDERFTADLRRHPTADAFVASLRPRQRQRLRRYGRRAAEAGLATRVVDPREADLDGLLELVRATMAKFGATSFFPEGLFQRFVTALGDRARIIEQRLDGRLIGGAACLVDEERLHFWISGVDYGAAPTFSPNYLLFLEGIHEALRRGVPVFEGGRRNGPFKELFGLRGRPLLAYVAPVG
ncbi:GNAT family N-acetyltransferase [Streptomyces daliensis]|uniref:GNAT family N-acetyltransferase n=1 Tax=Streptomyces daliensis TaxID=299421 RepID=A0A8T4ILI0_9ACTN|nr:GNAT family N-acetyltransferase [Streptomyces daliensis]